MSGTTSSTALLTVYHRGRSNSSSKCPKPGTAGWFNYGLPGLVNSRPHSKLRNTAVSMKFKTAETEETWSVSGEMKNDWVLKLMKKLGMSLDCAMSVLFLSSNIKVHSFQTEQTRPDILTPIYSSEMGAWFLLDHFLSVLYAQCCSYRFHTMLLLQV